MMVGIKCNVLISTKLFVINHILGMLRDNIKRIMRNSWCTTKRANVLADILAIYSHHHYTQLITNLAKYQG